MPIMTRNHRLQRRWTPHAIAGGTAAAAMVRSMREVGFATRSKATGGSDGASGPGRAQLGRDDT